MASELLKALGGKPYDLIADLDFETFWDSDYALKKLTTEAYVRDPRFETIGVGVKWDGQPSIWLEDWEFREWARRVDWKRVAVTAHHAHFDGLILSHHYGIRPGFWFDTLSMGRVLHGVEVGGSLAKMAEHYQVGKKGDEVLKTQGKRRADFSQAAWARFGAYCNNDVELTARLRVAMTPQLPKSELWLIDTTVRAFTEPVFEADQKILQETLIAERRNKAALLARIGATREALSSNDQFAELLRKLDIDPPMKPNAKGKMIYAFAKSDPGMQELEESPRDNVRALIEARLAIKSTIVETRTERLISASRRGRVPFYLRYAGAHTHRWSGGDKMNPQNFNRGGALRKAILAPPGHVLAVADLGQIEARMIAWLAGEETLLHTFRRNDKTKGDFYSDVGSSFFMKKLSKEETPLERQVSKNMILGLGFGMGWRKFSGELLKGMLGTDSVKFGEKEARAFKVDPSAFEAAPSNTSEGATCGDEVEEMIMFGVRVPYGELLVHCAVAYHLVRMYRGTYKRIEGLWWAMRDVLETMIKPDGKMTFGPLKITHETIEKPNGLKLRYPGLKRGEKGFTYMGSKNGRPARTKIYGGLLTENVVQSLARDVMAEHVLWIRAAGERIATTTHDEAVAVPRADRGKECLDLMLARMKIPPAWCPDLPLNASGSFARSYGDCK